MKILVQCGFIFMIWCFLTPSCKNPQSPSPKDTIISYKYPTPKNQKKLIFANTQFFGNLGKFPLLLNFNYVGPKIITGFSIAYENKRNFTGKYYERDDTFFMSLQEPGTSDDDGIFELICKNRDSIITGFWINEKTHKKLPVCLYMSKLFPSINQFNNTIIGEFELFKEELDTITNTKQIILSLYYEGYCKLKFYKNMKDDKEQFTEQLGYWYLNKNRIKIVWVKDYFFNHKVINFVVKKIPDNSFENYFNHYLECIETKIKFNIGWRNAAVFN